MSDKNNAALSPIEVDTWPSKDRVRLTVDAERLGVLGFTGHDDESSIRRPRWTWDAAQLRAASQALASLADQLDDPRRNAGPGCTWTQHDAREGIRQMGYINPIAVIDADGTVLVGYPGTLYRGATWWEASAKAGLFGTAIAETLRVGSRPLPDEPAAMNMLCVDDWWARGVVVSRNVLHMPTGWGALVERSPGGSANTYIWPSMTWKDGHWHAVTLPEQPTIAQLNQAIADVRAMLARMASPSDNSPQIGYRGTTIGVLCRACGAIGTMTSADAPETPGPCRCDSSDTVYVTPPRD